MSTHRKFVSLVAVCALAFLAAGCAEKAKTLQLGASQFSAQSISAINLAQSNAEREVTDTALTDQQKRSQFVSRALSGAGDAAPSKFDTWIGLYEPQTSPGAAARQAEYDKLRGQYFQFSKVFASLQQGSALSADAVGESVPIIKKLAAHMAALAHNQQKYPVEFMRERTRLLDEINAVRNDRRLSANEKSYRMNVMAERVENLAKAEGEANRQAVEAATKAAIMGLELMKLADAYGTVTLDDIVEGIGIAFDVASQVSGRDLTKLQGKVDDIVNQINADEEMKALFNEALSQLPTT